MMMATGLRERERTAVPAGGRALDEQVISGTDDEFMRVLYERYRPQLQCYVMRLTREAQWAEDIVQAALVRAWRARHQLTLGEAATRSWLFTAAYRIFIDEYRSRSARPVTLTGQDIAAPGVGGNETERLDWSVTLASALAALSKPQRQAIVHVYYLNRTIDETASMLSVSPGTVKSRLYYAIRALRDQLTLLLWAMRLPSGRCQAYLTTIDHTIAVQGQAARRSCATAGGPRYRPNCPARLPAAPGPASP